MMVFLSVACKGDLLILGDTPFEGELGDKARDGASMVRYGALSELSICAKACGDLYYSVMPVKN